MANTTKATEQNAGQVEDVQGQDAQAEAQPKPNPDLTPYAAAKVVTAAVRRRTGNTDFTMQPQTMYGLAKRNVIATVEVPGTKADGKSKIYFKGEAFAKWLKGYLGSGSVGEVNRNTDYEALAEQYINGILDEAVARGVQDEREPETVGTEAE
jgi:hypothetical protein